MNFSNCKKDVKIEMWIKTSACADCKPIMFDSREKRRDFSILSASSFKRERSPGSRELNVW